ncbi:MAG: FAD-dependent oxidoreductase, partial [Polyangiaceae bacterium]
MLKFDLFVLGSGPAGQRAAVQAAKLGKTVGISERREALGGAWINTGTIPSKTFREAVLYLSGYGQRGMYGDASNVDKKITMDDLLSRCRAVIKHEIEVIRAQMKRNGVTLLNGAASFVDPHHLVVQSGSGAKEEIDADVIVIATGTVPAAPLGVPVNGETIIDSDGILTLKELPRTMTVVGAGVIGVEYATMFGALGVKVTVVDKRARLLEFVDAEIAASLSYQMRNSNCTLRLNEDVAEVTI